MTAFQEGTPLTRFTFDVRSLAVGQYTARFELLSQEEALVQEGILRETLPPAGSRAYLFVKP